MSLIYLLSLIVFSLVDATGAELLPVEDSLSIVTQSIRARCLERAKYCAEKLPTIKMLPAEKIAEMSVTANRWFSMDPAEVVNTMKNACEGSIERYRNIVSMCDQYLTSQDIKYLVLVHYLLKHSQEVFKVKKREACYVEVWSAFGVYEKEHMEGIESHFNDNLLPRKDVRLLLPALQEVSFESENGGEGGNAKCQITITIADKISKTFQTFQRQKDEWSCLGGDANLLMQHTASVTDSFLKFTLLARSLELERFHFAVLPWAGEGDQLSSTAPRLQGIDFIQRINAGVLYAFEGYARFCEIKDVIKEMGPVLEKLRGEKQKRDAAEERRRQ